MTVNIKSLLGSRLPPRVVPFGRTSFAKLSLSLYLALSLSLSLSFSFALSLLRRTSPHLHPQTKCPIRAHGRVKHIPNHTPQTVNPEPLSLSRPPKHFRRTLNPACLHLVQVPIRDIRSRVLVVRAPSLPKTSLCIHPSASPPSEHLSIVSLAVHVCPLGNCHWSPFLLCSPTVRRTFSIAYGFHKYEACRLSQVRAL